jgi:hypothetical protein
MCNLCPGVQVYEHGPKMSKLGYVAGLIAQVIHGWQHPNMWWMGSQLRGQMVMFHLYQAKSLCLLAVPACLYICKCHNHATELHLCMTVQSKHNYSTVHTGGLGMPLSC